MATPAAVLRTLIQVDGFSSASGQLARYDSMSRKAAGGTNALHGANKNVSGSLGTVSERSRTASSGVTSLGSSTKQANSSMGGMLKTVLAMGGAFVAYQAAKQAITYTLDLAGATLKLHDITGMDTKTASTWIEVMKVRGVSTKQTSMAFITLSRNIRSAQSGSKTATAAFDELGISQQFLRTHSIQDVVLKIAQAFQSGISPTHRAAIAQQLFGRGAQALIPILSKGRQGVLDALSAAQRYGAFLPKNVSQLRDARKAQFALNFAMDGMKIAFTQAVLPYLAKGAKALLAFVGQMRSGRGAGGQFASILKTSFRIVRDAIKTTIGVFGGLGNALKILATLWAINKVRQFIGVLRGVPGALTGIRAALTLLSMHPLMIAFTLLGLAIGYAMTHMKQFRRGCEIAWNAIKGIFNQGVSTVLGWVSSFLHGIGAVLTGMSHIPIIGDKFKGMARDVNHAADSIDAFRRKLTGADQPAQKAANGIGAAFQRAKGNMTSAIADMLRRYGDFHTKVGNTNASLTQSFSVAYRLIEQYIATHTGSARRRAQGDLAALKQAFITDAGKMRSTTGANFDAILMKIQTDTVNAKNRGSGNFQGLRNNIITHTNATKNSVSSGFANIASTVFNRTGTSRDRASSNWRSLQGNVTHQSDIAKNNVSNIFGGISGTVANQTTNARNTGSQHWTQLKNNIGGGTQAMWNAVRTGIGWIFDSVSSGLGALGSAVSININLHKGSVPYAQGGVVQYATGGMANRPTFMVGEEAPHHPEVVIATNPAYRNKNIGYWAKAGEMLGIPGFATGGGTQPGASWAGMQPGITRLARFVQSHFPALLLSSGARPGDGTSYHASGQAADLAADSGTMYRASAWINATGLWHQLLEGIHNPNLSVKNMQQVPSSLWGSSTWAQHVSHIHLAAGAVGQGLAALASIVAPKVTGGGKMGELAQRALDRMTKAANAYVLAHLPTQGSEAIGPLTPATGNVLRDINATLKPRGWNRLAIAGAMGNAYQESGWNPAAMEPGTDNGGLWGFTAAPVSLANLRAAAAARGVPWTNVPLQTAFMAAHYGDIGPLNAAGSVPNAAIIFEQTFERAGNIQMGNRIAAAQRAYAMGYKFGGVMPPFGGSFEYGGIVPGPHGAARTIVAHGGEPVGGPLVNIENMNVHDGFDEQALGRRLAFFLER